MKEYQTATVHIGPKGGVQFRLWKTADGNIFRIVSKYQAKPFMSAEEMEKADRMERDRREQKRMKAEHESIWRSIRRGG